MTNVLLPPDERAAHAAVAGARFQLGLDENQWRLVNWEWPNLIVAVSAAARASGPAEFVLRLNLTGYPQSAPTGTPWDLSTGTQLDQAGRPKGGMAGLVFRWDWEGGVALYAPFDRIAIERHGHAWADQYPRTKWTPHRDIAFYLEVVWDLLNSDEYLGV